MRVPIRRRGAGITPAGQAAQHNDDRQSSGYARMAGWSGVAFAVLFTLGLALVRQSPGLGATDADYAAFYAAGPGNVLVTLGLYIVPFAGIACLWHMNATRTLLQVLRPRSWSQIPHWLNLAAGVVFVCMLFVGAAAVGAVALLTQFSDAPLPPPDVARTLSAVGYAAVFVYGVRAAGMYMITTTGLARSAGLLPRAAAVVSYLAATFLLVSTTFHPAILLVFPAWVLLFSILLLVRRPSGVTS
ncbi:hypothetical protein [Pseudonocardia asaccharolytica]|uniref:DUF4386 domain-containing protein n=1 Tax=Pseudonocardia asaccharolytica DSM 44247 = NBRC 16224 TaxID=1123024 RepID=A0A511D1Q7_9PSEU|nr:hypothetical protein [Pseudonocardia asaccharolytica]GEL18711.1 hypothetical protein PA7_25480 [Pseudonocardia asaccharolytica DSM 44247 = NBRC 16224]